VDFFDKVKLLGEQAKFDLCGDCFVSKEIRRVKDINLSQWIYPTTLPDGKKVRLLKILMSNICENDCAYCPVSSLTKVPRISFSAEELAAGFMRLHRARLVSGLFLSSGVKYNPERTMQEMLDTVAILRRKYNFRGYIHLKILPGASLQSLETAFKLASRVSVNLEVPDEKYIEKISSYKNFAEDLLGKLKVISYLKKNNPSYLRDGFTTQFVVGAAGEKDVEIISRTYELYRSLRLSRVYYSAFQPVLGTPLENSPSTPPIREVRLYQADFLLRRYGFRIDEIFFNEEGNLSTLEDPKTIWANRHLDFFPVEIGSATYEELIRVPGIGPKSARKILALRKGISHLDLETLCLRIPTFRRALPYITVRGKKPVTMAEIKALF